VNLDLPPEQRFQPVLTVFNASLHKVYNDLIGKNKPFEQLLFSLVKKRGNETPEFQAEIDSAAKFINVPVDGLHGLQFLYELSTVMEPIENVTIPFRAACTGILAVDSTTGTVSHARNLDFGPKPDMQSIIYIAKFTRGGKEVYRAQTMAGYSLPVTGMKSGPNGFSIEVNTRFPEKFGGNTVMFHNLLDEKRDLNGWTIRKVFENAPDYETAVKMLSTTPYTAEQYNIIGGVRKGTILAREPDNTVFQLTLGKPNPEMRDDYIIITNFDFWWHDFREWFDPTGGAFFKPRRIVAQEIMNATKVLTPQVLFDVISAKGVIAGETVFQSVMNVETGLFNVSMTD